MSTLRKVFPYDNNNGIIFNNIRQEERKGLLIYCESEYIKLGEGALEGGIGGAIGGIVGTFVLPGVGTVIGASAAALIGKALGKEARKNSR